MEDTRLILKMSREGDSQTELKFTHADWKNMNNRFLCNTDWRHLM